MKKVTLHRPAAVTHHYDMNNRYIELAFSGGSGAGSHQLTAPRVDVAPPGYYLLFLLEERAGGRLVPSLASFVRFL